MPSSIMTSLDHSVSWLLDPHVALAAGLAKTQRSMERPRSITLAVNVSTVSWISSSVN